MGPQAPIFSTCFMSDADINDDPTSLLSLLAATGPWGSVIKKKERKKVPFLSISLVGRTDIRVHVLH